MPQGGTAANPVVFDGKGMIIDLGIDITAHDWIKDGDVWTSRGPLKGHPPVDDEQRAGLFIDEVPLRITRDRVAEKKSGVAKKLIFVAPKAFLPDQVGWAEDGSLYFRWPKDKKPGEARIFQPPPGLASGADAGEPCGWIASRACWCGYAEALGGSSAMPFAVLKSRRTQAAGLLIEGMTE